MCAPCFVVLCAVLRAGAILLRGRVVSWSRPRRRRPPRRAAPTTLLRSARTVASEAPWPSPRSQSASCLRILSSSCPAGSAHEKAHRYRLQCQGGRPCPRRPWRGSGTRGQEGRRGGAAAVPATFRQADEPSGWASCRTLPSSSVRARKGKYRWLAVRMGGQRGTLGGGVPWQHAQSVGSRGRRALPTPT